MTGTCNRRNRSQRIAAAVPLTGAERLALSAARPELDPVGLRRYRADMGLTETALQRLVAEARDVFVHRRTRLD